MATYWQNGIEYGGCPIDPACHLTPAEEAAALDTLPHPYRSDIDTDDPRWLAGVDALQAARLAKWEATPAGRPATAALF